MKNTRKATILDISTRDVLLKVFITVQNLVEIGSAVSIVPRFNDFCDLAGNCLFTPILERFLGDLTT